MEKNLTLCCIFLAATTAASGYCAITCTVNGREIQHIACGNDGKFGALCPKDVALVYIDEALQHVFLEEYNSLRNFVAGGANSTYDYSPACRMATIQWDEELAGHAALRSKRCTIMSDSCHTTSTFQNSGQDAMEYHQFVTVAIKDIITSTISGWFHLIRRTKFSDILADRNIRLGCAIATAPSDYEVNENGVQERMQIYWLTCNYATDIHSRADMYETCDLPAKSCTTGTNPRYTNLCSVDECYEQQSS